MIYYQKFPVSEEKIGETEFARELLRYGLQEEYGIHTLPCILETEYGKPYFPDRKDICFNYSHSRHAAACVISDQKVGIDLEEIRDYRENLVRRICHRNELLWFETQKNKAYAFIRIWTIKEAYLKCIGIGLRRALNELDFSEVLGRKRGGYYEDYRIQTFLLEDSVLTVCLPKDAKTQHIVTRYNM